MSRFSDQLNAQIGNEFEAHQQYLAIAVHYDFLTMPQMAAFFYAQASEERNHAMMMIQYLLDVDEAVQIPGTQAPTCAFDGVIPPVELSVAQEKRVTTQIHELARIAREENDFGAEQFLQWFIKEQVEEVATMGDLLTVVSREDISINDIEAYIAREQGGGSSDLTAPRIAGAKH
ncbi:ferritin [Gephyromycinifex aptenodytis]|uniref:ferritin n=1 Tax=Gephyromycinifex aptenodytis TaxID=2716227 RepID=UPI00144684E9|nr:ferritin [Gephyromycinifex aptenodytis]